MEEEDEGDETREAGQENYWVLVRHGRENSTLTVLTREEEREGGKQGECEAEGWKWMNEEWMQLKDGGDRGSDIANGMDGRRQVVRYISEGGRKKEEGKTVRGM